MALLYKTISCCNAAINLANSGYFGRTRYGESPEYQAFLPSSEEILAKMKKAEGFKFLCDPSSLVGDQIEFQEHLIQVKKMFLEFLQDSRNGLDEVVETPDGRRQTKFITLMKRVFIFFHAHNDLDGNETIGVAISGAGNKYTSDSNSYLEEYMEKVIGEYNKKMKKNFRVIVVNTPSEETAMRPLEAANTLTVKPDNVNGIMDLTKIAGKALTEKLGVDPNIDFVANTHLLYNPVCAEKAMFQYFQKALCQRKAPPLVPTVNSTTFNLFAKTPKKMDGVQVLSVSEDMIGIPVTVENVEKNKMRGFKVADLDNKRVFIYSQEKPPCENCKEMDKYWAVSSDLLMEKVTEDEDFSMETTPLRSSGIKGSPPRKEGRAEAPIEESQSLQNEEGRGLLFYLVLGGISSLVSAFIYSRVRTRVI